MSKLTLNDLTTFSTQSAVTSTNNNNSLIEIAIENTLSRDGTAPNQMGADLDLNSNDVLNVGTIGVTTVDAGTVDATTIEAVTINATGSLEINGVPVALAKLGGGLPVGGTAGQVLSKIDSGDYNTHWVNQTGGGGGGSGTVTSVTSADANATVVNTTSTPVITIVSAPKLQTARTIAGVSFDGTANISLNTNAITNGAGYTTNAGTVTTASVATANGFAGTVATATTTPAITVSTTVTGVLKGNGTAISAASAGTDYQAPITLTTTGTSGAATLVSNTLNIPQYSAGGGGDASTNTSTSVDGEVTLFSGTAGKTLKRATGTGLVKLTSGVLSTATSGTDYSLGTSALSTGIVKSTTTTGALTIAVAGTDYQAPITLTTTGTSGAATLVSNTLNIPQYSAGGGGDASTNTSSSVDGEIALFSGTAGKTLKRATGSGIAKITSGVLGTATSGTDYEVPLTFSTGLTRSTNTVMVNTSQSISTLSNLTSNGSVQTSGGTGALSVVANTGTGSNVLATSPTLVTPVLGTPTSVTLTNATGLPLSTGVTGTLQAAQFPALTGDVTTTAGSLATTVKSNLKLEAINAILNGGGSAIPVSSQGDIVIPFAGTITGVTLLADVSGSIVIDIWKDTYANYPPTIADTITASALPTISSAIKSQDTTLTGWTTSVTAGDVIRFNVNSCSTITRCNIILSITRS